MSRNSEKTNKICGKITNRFQEHQVYKDKINNVQV